MRGKVIDVSARIGEDGRLRAEARVSRAGKDILVCVLPERETAAFLPKSILVGRPLVCGAPRSLLYSLTPILRRFCVGREVNVSKNGRFTFPSWSKVRFAEE